MNRPPSPRTGRLAVNGWGPRVLLAAVALLVAGGGLVVKADEAEAFEASRERAFLSGAAALAAVAAVLVLAWSLWRFMARRHSRELALRDERLRLLRDNAQDMVFFATQDGRLLEANRAAERALGFTAEEFAAMSIADLRAPEVRGRVQGEMEAAGGPEGATLETLFLRKDGASIPVEISVRVVEHEGAIIRMAVARDITERKRAEATSREMEHLLSESQRIVHLGSWGWDMKGPIKWTDETYRVYGVSPDSFTPTPDSLVNLLHAEDRPIMQRWLEACQAGQAPDDLEFRTVMPDGTVRHLLGRGDLICDDRNQPVFMAGTVQDITARKRAEEALRESEERLRLSTELGGVAVWEYDLAANSMSRSGNHDRLYGLEWQSRWDLDTFLGATHPDDRELSIGHIKRSVAAGGPDKYQFEFRVIHPDRSIHWLAVSGQVTERDSAGRGKTVRGCLVDITGLKQAEGELGRRVRQLSALNALGRSAGASLDMTAVAQSALEEIRRAVSPDLALLFIKEGNSLRLLGTAASEGGPVHSETPTHRVGECLCGRAARDGHALYSADILRDERCTWEECRRAGVRSFAALPLRAGGEVIGVLGLASATERDFEEQAVFLETLADHLAAGVQNARLHERIGRHAADLESRVEERTAQLAEANHLLQAQMAERRKTHAEIERLNEDLRRRAKELQVANRHLQNALDKSESAERVKSAFLAAMSHELRTPLNSVIGFTGVLLGGLAGAVSQEQREALEIVRRNGEHLLALINDVLDLSKIEAGQMRLALRPFELASVVRESVEALRPLAEAKGLSLALEPGEGTLALQGDRRRVAQILMNLLSNAVKFTQSGGIRVAVSRDEPRQEACVAVTDTGPGILESDLERIFGEFEQLDSGTARVQEGTGLGLSLSRKLARMMGGDIRAESKRGAGSTFRCILPLRETLDGREADSRG